MSRRTHVREVVQFLELDASRLLTELRAEGLFEEEEVEPREAEELRVAATLVNELGVNPAGVEVVLHLRRRLLCLQERMERVLGSLPGSDER